MRAQRLEGLSGLRGADAFEVLGPDLELAGLILAADADRNDLAAIDAKWTTILDHYPAPLAAS
jgi:hypothetical protein